jgi:hypothetical protein
VKKVIPLLMIIFEWLNPTIQAHAIVIANELVIEGEDEKNNMFDINASMEKTSHALVVGEVSLFQGFFITSSMCANPLTWWQNHEGQFLNVSFFPQTNSWDSHVSN